MSEQGLTNMEPGQEKEKMQAEQGTLERTPELTEIGVNFLKPETTELIFGFDNFLYAVVKSEDGNEEKVYRGVFAVLCFPVTCPHNYVALHYFDERMKEQEVGIIRDPSVFPREIRTLLASSLAKYYFEFEITRVHRIEFHFSLLMFDVDTNQGPRQFEMRWQTHRAQDYGEKGKVLFDVFDTRYVIRDIDQLPPEDREIFTRYIYW